MVGWFNLRYRLGKSFRFSETEIRILIISILVLGFLVGYSEGQHIFRTVPWLYNLFNSVVIMSLVMLVHATSQKIMGLHFGQMPEIRIWPYGMLLGFVLAFASNGKILFLASTGIVMTHMAVERLGTFRYGLSLTDNAFISLAGPLANVLLAILFKALSVLPVGGLVSKCMMVSLVFAVSNMLPIPPLDGANIFFASRSLYVFMFAGILTISFLLIKTSLLTALIGALAAAVIVFFIFFVLVEEGGDPIG